MGGAGMGSGGLAQRPMPAGPRVFLAAQRDADQSRCRQTVAERTGPTHAVCGVPDLNGGQAMGLCAPHIGHMVPHYARSIANSGRDRNALPVDSPTAGPSRRLCSGGRHRGGFLPTMDTMPRAKCLRQALPKRGHGKRLARTTPSRRLARCLRLVDLLQFRVGCTIEDLARELEVSNRTVYRDFHVLEEAGIPRCFDKSRGGHVLAPHFRTKPSGLTDDELVALLLAARLSPLSSGRKLGSAICMATNKLLARAAKPAKDEIARLLESVDVEPSDAASSATDERVVLEFIEAIGQGRRLHVIYQPHTGFRVETETVP